MMTSQELAARKAKNAALLATELENESEVELEEEIIETKVAITKAKSKSPGKTSITIRIPVSYGKESNHIMIGAEKYLHGFTYEVDPATARDLRWIMQQTLVHDHQVRGEGRFHVNTVRTLSSANF